MVQVGRAGVYQIFDDYILINLANRDSAPRHYCGVERVSLEAQRFSRNPTSVSHQLDVCSTYILLTLYHI